VELKNATIQTMQIEDLDQVMSLERTNPLTVWSKQMFIEEMRHPVAYCFVMKTQDGAKHPVIGFICFRNVEEESELLNICVRPDCRRLGVGRKLMRFYVEFSRQRGIETLHLEVSSSNQPAIRLYQSLAYESSGLRKNFYQGRLDALVMTKKV
jgi:ribosomal-protein-alanine N-acetyltransferase